MPRGLKKRKKIKMGLPMDKGLGDIITLLSLANASDLTFQVREEDATDVRVDLVRENATIEVAENPLSEKESIKIYGDLDEEKKARTLHQSIRYLKAFGVYGDKVELVPRMNFTKEEDEYGKTFVSQFKKPTICFCPTGGTIPSVSSFVPEEAVNGLTRFLEKYFTVLYISKLIDLRCWKTSFIDLSGTEIYSIRDRAAIMKHADAYLGIDTGLTHLAIAAGCKSFVWHKNLKGECYDQNFRNYGYTKEMWRDEECIISNYDADNIKEMPHDLMRVCCNYYMG